MKRFVVPLLVALLFTRPLHAADKRQQLADQGRQSIVTVTRVLTMATWSDRIDAGFNSMQSGKQLGAKWNASEPHRKQAQEKILAMLGRAFDDLKDTAPAREKMDAPFQSLTESDAAEVLALSKAHRQKLDNRSDLITVAVAIMEDHPDLKSGTLEFDAVLRPVQKAAGLTPTIEELKLPVSEKAMRAYQQTREFSVRSLRTAIDGQLQLYFFDHQAGIETMMRAAASDAVAANKAASPR